MRSLLQGCPAQLNPPTTPRAPHQAPHAGPGQHQPAADVQESRISTGTPVARLDVNPHDAQQCVVSLSQGPPALLSFRDDSKRILPCIPPGAT